MKDVELCRKVKGGVFDYWNIACYNTAPLILIGLILTLFLTGFSFSKEVPFTQEDSERLIRVETKVDVGFQQIDKRVEQVDKRIEHVDKRIEQVEKRISDLITFIWILAGVFVGIVGITMSFALWDRRTMVRPFEDRIKETERCVERTWNTLIGGRHV